MDRVETEMLTGLPFWTVLAGVVAFISRDLLPTSSSLTALALCKWVTERHLILKFGIFCKIPILQRHKAGDNVICVTHTNHSTLATISLDATKEYTHDFKMEEKKRVCCGTPYCSVHLLLKPFRVFLNVRDMMASRRNPATAWIPSSVKN